MRIVRTLAVTLLALAALAAHAETLKAHHEKSLAPKPGGTLRVEAAFQDVVVTFAPASSKVEVVVDLEISMWPGDGKAYLAALAPTFDEKGDHLVVRSKTSGFSHIGMLQAKGTIAVTLPPGMALDLDTGSGDIKVEGDSGGKPVSADTGSGDISVKGRISGFQADTGSGDVLARIEGPCGEVKVDTGSGDVDFSGAAEHFAADTGSGEVKATGLSGGASFNTGSGSIEASFAALGAGAKVEADTGSGDVQLRFPQGFSPSGLLETSSGTIQCDLPGTPNKRGDTFALSGTAGALKVETGSGDITILAAK